MYDDDDFTIRLLLKKLMPVGWSILSYLSGQFNILFQIMKSHYGMAPVF